MIGKTHWISLFPPAFSEEGQGAVSESVPVAVNKKWRFKRMSDLSELRKFLRAVLSWWWLLLLFIAAAAIASYMFTSRQEKVYEATATVIVGQSIQTIDPTSQDIDTSRRLAQTYALIIRRQPIMQAVIDTLKLDVSWRNLRSRTKIFLVPNTQLIEVTVEASTPEEARMVADEVTRQIIRYSPTLDSNSKNDERSAFIAERLARLKDKIVTNQAEIDLKEEAYLKAGLESERQAIRREINQIEGMLSNWENNYSRLVIVNESNEASNYVAIIEPAQANNSPVRPDVQMNVLLASAVGLLLGLTTIFLLENLDDTLKSEDALEQEVHLIPLGVVSQMKIKKEHDKLLTAQNPFSAAQEAFRIIRSNIQFMAVDRPSKTIMVTSADAGDGKSLTAANMGLAMAQAGLRTILVDADLRQPKLHTLFKLTNREGLTDLLAPTDIEVDQALKGTTLEHLKILTSGTRPPNPTELLGSQRMRQLLAMLSEMADVVILDSMPVLPVADSVVLSNRVDGVILVVDSTRTRRSDLKKAIQALEKADAKIWGAVLNRVPRSRTRYYAKEFIPEAVAGKARLRSLGR